MTINERLALMDEISRKNNAEWGKFKRPRRLTYGLHPVAEWALKCLVTFCMVILLGIVAIIAA